MLNQLAWSEGVIYNILSFLIGNWSQEQNNTGRFIWIIFEVIG